MRKRLASGLLLAGLLGADFKADHWPYRKRIPVEAEHQLHVLRLDPEVYRNARPDLADLRVITGGQETPYVLEVMSGNETVRELPARMLDKTVVRGSDLQFTLDAGEGIRHNRLRIVAAKSDFRTRVRIETSGDNRAWSVVRNDASLLDFSRDGERISRLEVDYAESTRRYVRATLFGWKSSADLENAWLLSREGEHAVRQVVATVEPRNAADGILLLDAGPGVAPYDQVRLEIEDAAFQRWAELESGKDGKQWSPLSRADLLRAGKQESLAIAFAERQDPYLRLKIKNGDNKPLTVRRAQLERLERHIKLMPASTGECWLYYGNRKARRASYDLANFIEKLALSHSTVLTAGPQERSPNYRGPEPEQLPFSERYPRVLWGALLIAVGIMGLILLRFWTKVKHGS